MATLLNSVSPTANPSVKSTRKAHAFMYMYMHNLPNLHSVSLKKGVSRILASNTQMSVTPKEAFVIPDWKGSERDDTKTKECLLYDAYKHFVYKMGLGHKPDPVQGEELLHALYEWGKWDKAIRVAELMLTSGVMPDMRLSFLCRRGLVGQVMQLMEKLEEYGYPINNKVYTPLVRGFSKLGRLSLQVLERLLRKGLVPNEYTNSVLVEAVCREKGVDEAMRVLDEIRTHNLFCYNVLLRGLCNEHRIDDAIRLFGDLPSKGFDPNVESCNILLDGLLHENRWEEATALLAEMGEAFHPNVETCNVLIRYLVQQGKVDAAFEVLDDIKRAKLNTIAASYNSVLEPICKEGKVDLAVKCVDLMISHRCRPTAQTFNAVAELYRHGKALDGFILIQRLWNANPLPKHERFHVIMCLCKNGNTRPAFQLLSEMRKDGYVLGSHRFHSLIRELCAEGKGDEAMEAVSVMEEFGYRPSMPHFNSLIVGLCQLQRTDLSIQVLERMIEKGYKPCGKTYIALVRGIAHEGELELAKEVLKELHQKQLLSTNVVKKVRMEFDFKSVCKG